MKNNYGDKLFLTWSFLMLLVGFMMGYIAFM